SCCAVGGHVCRVRAGSQQSAYEAPAGYPPQGHGAMSVTPPAYWPPPLTAATLARHTRPLTTLTLQAAPSHAPAGGTRGSLASARAAAHSADTPPTCPADAPVPAAPARRLGRGR